MTTFDDREKAFEAKYQHDEELRFKVNARRARLFGRWAADKLGKTGDDIDAYAKEVIAADFEEPGEEDIIRKVKADFAAGNVDVSDHRIRKTLEELLVEAKRQIDAGE